MFSVALCAERVLLILCPSPELQLFMHLTKCLLSLGMPLFHCADVQFWMWTFKKNVRKYGNCFHSSGCWDVCEVMSMEIAAKQGVLALLR